MKNRAATAIIFGITLIALASVACNSAGATGGAPASATATTTPAPTAPAPTPPADDDTTQAPATVEVDAPIESVEVVTLESSPAQYMLRIVSGLPGGCAQFNGYESSIDGATINVAVTNLVPFGPVACTAIYGYHEGEVVLGNAFAVGESYTVIVNGEVTETFTAR